MLAAGHHAGDAWGHLGAQGDAAVSAVGEGVGLLVDDLFAGLGSVKLGRFEDGGIVLFITEALEGLSPYAEDVVLDAQVFGVEIADALVGLGGKLGF